MFAKYVGITNETATLIEYFRENPGQSEDDIIRKSLGKLREIDRLWGRKEETGVDSVRTDNAEFGCDLGMGAVLRNKEGIFCFRYKSSMEARKPEGVAIARDGKLFIDGQEVHRSRGSLVQPALQLIQRKIKDVSKTTGDLTSLDAWEYWYVEREGKFVPVGHLRKPNEIRRRTKRHELSEEEIAAFSDDDFLG